MSLFEPFKKTTRALESWNNQIIKQDPKIHGQPVSHTYISSQSATARAELGIEDGRDPLN